MKFTKKVALLSLSLCAAPVLAPLSQVTQSVVQSAHADDSLLTIIILLLTTSALGGFSRADSAKCDNLISEAYAGRGEKLEIIARASNLSVEDAADKIVALKEAGKIDANKPAEMIKTLQTELQ